MGRLILIRHGQSVWNLSNRFTGWVDIPLTAEGIAQARALGTKLSSGTVDVVFTSELIRTKQTAMAIVETAYPNRALCFVQDDPVLEEAQKLAEGNRCFDPQAQKSLLYAYSSWKLNERYYGHLQGLDKQEAAARWGAEQVHQWRRSYLETPPGGESLKETAERVLPYFQTRILPLVRDGLSLMVCAHGNSIRALIMLLEQLSDHEVEDLEVAPCEARDYTYNEGSWLLHP